MTFCEPEELLPIVKVHRMPSRPIVVGDAPCVSATPTAGGFGESNPSLPSRRYTSEA